MKPRIRILKCILDSRFGGPHRRSFAIAERLQAEGVETVFLFGDKGGGQASLCHFECIYLTHLQFLRRHRAVANGLGFFWSLGSNLTCMRRLIRSKGIDIVEVDGITNVVPALAAHLEQVPILWYYNEPHVPAPVSAAVLPVVMALSTKVVVQGERLKEVRTRSRKRLYDKTIVLYPGVDLGRFDPARYEVRAKQRLRAELSVPPDGPLIGIVGNLTRWKGHTYFLKAAAQLKERVPTARFVIVGRRLDTDPGYWRYLRRLTDRLGLGEDVVYTGFRDDIPAVLGALDVFVLSSIWESCPNVVLEAMAMKVPVVATDVGAVPEMVLHGRTGLVVPASNTEAIARGVLTYLRKPRGEMEEMLNAGRERAERVFSLRETVERQKGMYEELTAGRR